MTPLTSFTQQNLVINVYTHDVFKEYTDYPTNTFNVLIDTKGLRCPGISCDTCIFHDKCDGTLGTYLLTEYFPDLSVDCPEYFI